MSAILEAGIGTLWCDYTARHTHISDCQNNFRAYPGQSLIDAEEAARKHGWVTVEAFGSVAHICPEHAHE